LTRNSIVRALLLAGALVGFIWYFVFRIPVVEAEILVIDKDLIEWPNEKPPVYLATIIAEGDLVFGIDASPIDSTREALYASIEQGCIYAIVYFDDARVIRRSRREGGTAKTIRKVRKISCPGIK
jgi:hypothetical protein